VASRRTSATVTGRAAITYTYDKANQLTLISQGSSNTAFAYNPAVRRSTLTLPNGVTVTYSYDQSSQLTGITYQYAGTDLGNLSYSYDLAGRRSGVTGSFARTGVPSLLSSATYDAANRLTQWGGTTLNYDANGNPIYDGVNNLYVERCGLGPGRNPFRPRRCEPQRDPCRCESAYAYSRCSGGGSRLLPRLELDDDFSKTAH
jgi:YD repeat-containing protein